MEPKSPVVTNHPNEEVDIDVAFGTSNPDLLTNEQIDGIIADIMSSVDSDDNELSTLEDYFGNKDVNNGGSIGSLMLLARSHLSASLNAGELTRADIGKIYGGVISSAISGGIEILNSKAQLSIELIKSKVSTLSSIVELERIRYEKDKLKSESELASFNVNVIGPLQREDLKEKIYLSHTEHEIRTYYKDNMQGIEKDLLTKNSDLTSEKINVEAENVKLIQSSTSLNDEKVNLTSAEKTIVEYDGQIKDNWMNQSMDYFHERPEWETKLSKAKAEIELQNAGYDKNNVFSEEDSIAFVRMEQMKTQTELYTRQKDSYDDIRYQKLLQTVMNYNAMIYPDLLAEDTLIAWAVNKDTGSMLYNKLVTTDMAVPTNNTAIDTTV